MLRDIGVFVWQKLVQIFGRARNLHSELVAAFYTSMDKWNRLFGSRRIKIQVTSINAVVLRVQDQTFSSLAQGQF
jgi:hypothetical protein